MARIVELLVSPVHRWDGRPSPDVTTPATELVPSVTVRAGLGIVGDRYFNRRAHADAAITVLATESLVAWPGIGLRETRRSILLEGVDVDAGLGRTLSLDCGDGPVLLRLRRPATPCRWLDTAIAPGAWQALRGRAGVRCEPLTDGILRVGPVQVEWRDAMDAVAGQVRTHDSGVAPTRTKPSRA